MKIDRLTKLIVLVSMTAALVVEAALMRDGWPPILPVTIAVLAASFAASLRFSGQVAAFVLLFTYTYPAIVFLQRGRFEVGYMTPWMAALLGVVLASGVRRGWAVPFPWRMPLALWALTVALLWPIVALRELDFSLATLDVPRLSVAGSPGVPPRLAIVWTLNVTFVLGAGILWFDWLYATFRSAEARFRRTIVGALAASWIVTTSFAAYQMLVDVTFMNSGRFGFLQRASGLMFDANPFGIIAALGIPAIAATALLTSWRGRSASVAAVVALSWLGLWASGSRTALATGAIGTLFVLYFFWDRVARTRHVRRQWLLPALAVVLALIAVPVVLQQLSDVGPWRRLQETLPRLTLAELWNRNGYGLNASHMIRDYPGFGVGIGSFHHLVLDYSRLPDGGGSIPTDNAQNWYRHQFAELGLFGSLGWIVWTVMFGWFVLTSARSGEGRWAAGSIRGALVAIAAISLLGMPAQNLAVTLTLWTLAFWYAVVAWDDTGEVNIHPRSSGANPSISVGSTRDWIAIWGIAALCAAGTLYSARHELRVPNRAARFGWPYQYGFYNPETGPHGPFRWAARHAVAVVEASKPWMKLTVSVNHPDLARMPVEAIVWRDSEEVLIASLATPEPVTEYVSVPDGRSRIVLETRVDRVLRPADYGSSDPRELGLMVQWEFVDRPGAPKPVTEGF